jgi:arylamine N-acetyltransferase
MADAGSERLAAYCARIGLGDPPSPTPEGLTCMQAAHRQAITFENIDVLLGHPVLIDSESVFTKLVTRGRGGYCFEQNRLYADMLELIGIANRPLLGRPRLALPEGFTGPRTHVLLLAELEGMRWIADAGFGGSFVPPLKLEDLAEATTSDGARHRLRRVDQPDGEWLLERAGPRATTDGRARDDEGWQAQYSFDLAAVMPMDLEQANHWTATWPGSRFLAGPVVSLVLEDGFAALTDTTFSIGRKGVVERRDLAGPEEWLGVLAETFGISLSPAEMRQLAIFPE